MWKLLNCKMIPAKCPKGREQGRHRQCKDKAKEQGRHTELCLYFTLLEEEFRFMVGRSHCTPLRPSQRKTQANITHKRGSGQPLPTAGKYALTNAEENLAPSGTNIMPGKLLHECRMHLTLSTHPQKPLLILRYIKVLLLFLDFSTGTSLHVVFGLL